MIKQTELERLEQEIQSLLEQWRAETDPEKKYLIAVRRYYLRREWHKIAPPWNVVGMGWDPNFILKTKTPAVTEVTTRLLVLRTYRVLSVSGSPEVVQCVPGFELVFEPLRVLPFP
jgi:hypothetical protein